MSTGRSGPPAHRIPRVPRPRRGLKPSTGWLTLVGAGAVVVGAVLIPAHPATLSPAFTNVSSTNPLNLGGSLGSLFATATTTTTTAPPTTTTTTTSTTSTTTTTTTAAPTTTTATSGGSSCGGNQVLVSNGITWDCTFDTEFTDTTLDTTQWAPVTTATSGYTSGLTACFVDSPNNISVGNGYLSLTARKEAAPFTCVDPKGNFRTQYTSGTIATRSLFDQAYGRFEVSAKVPTAAVAGLQSSLWLYPQTMTYGPWPASGEIDLAEVYSRYADRGVPYLHYNYNHWTTNQTTDTNVVTNTNCLINVGQFNDYVVEWTPTSISVFFNGQTCLVDHWIPRYPETAPQPFDQPFFINLTQALGVGTNKFSPSLTPLPATTEVQYVRVWQMQS